MQLEPSNQKWTWTARFPSLMRESEYVIHHAADAGSDAVKAIAKPIIDDGKEYRLWEGQHASFMRKVAGGRSRPLQLVELRQIIMATVHRTALVNLVKQYRLEDDLRTSILSHFRPGKAYMDAWVSELQGYCHMQSSAFCARHLAVKLGDPLLRTWLTAYTGAYGQYFADYCRMILAERRGQGDIWHEAVAARKKDVMSKRRLILDNARSLLKLRGY